MVRRVGTYPNTRPTIIMDYYRVKDGQTVYGQDDQVLGKDGDVIKLATDSKDKTVRHEAEGVLMGQWSRVTKLPGNPNAKPKPTKKKATKIAKTYKTTEMKAEG